MAIRILAEKPLPNAIEVMVQHETDAAYLKLKAEAAGFEVQVTTRPGTADAGLQKVTIRSRDNESQRAIFDLLELDGEIEYDMSKETVLYAIRKGKSTYRLASNPIAKPQEVIRIGIVGPRMQFQPSDQMSSDELNRWVDELHRRKYVVSVTDVWKKPVSF